MKRRPKALDDRPPLADGGAARAQRQPAIACLLAFGVPLDVLSQAQSQAPERVQSVLTEACPVALQSLSPELNHPWGMAFYQRHRFPEWRASALIGSLTDSSVVRVALQGDRIASEERILMGERVRDVEVGPDGPVCLLTDGRSGKLRRMAPLSQARK